MVEPVAEPQHADDGRPDEREGAVAQPVDTENEREGGEPASWGEDGYVPA